MDILDLLERESVLESVLVCVRWGDSPLFRGVHESVLKRDRAKTDSSSPGLSSYPLDTMDSFFTDTLTLKTLADAWSARKQELRTLQRTLARDELLAHLKTHCIETRAQIYEELTDAIRTALSRDQLHVPIWSYRAAHFRGWVDNHGQELRRVQELGQDDTMLVNGRTERIHTIVRQTDFETRLAAFFGPAFRVRSVKESAIEGWSELWESHTWTLVLDYFPETPPETPAPASPLSEPPPLVRRGSSGLQDYDGLDGLRQAAQDMMTDILTEPCHCGYHHDA